MQISKRGWGALWLHPGHLIWVLLVYLVALGQMSVPLTGDQKVYLSIASEMWWAGEWLQPLLFGAGSYFKPPFQYWMTLIGWKMFGYSLWGALIPSVLAVVATAWWMGEIVYMLKERRWFVSAGLWFGAALGTATYGTVAQMEIWLCFFYAASWWFALKFFREDRKSRRWRWIYLAFLMAGLSALVKSPLYSVFWVLGFMTYVLVAGEWETFRNRHLYLAWALGILAGASWYIYILWIDRSGFLQHYFVQETLQKGGGNQSTFFTIWIALLYMCFPFTFLIIPAVRAMFVKNRGSGILKFAICWSWPPALFFTFYPYRVSTYLFILVPVMAALVDWTYYRVGRSRFYQFSLRLSGGVFLIVCALLGFVIFRSEIAPSWVAAGFLVCGIWGAVCAGKDWMRGFALCGLAGVLFFRLTAVSLGEEDLAGLRRATKDHPEARLAMLDEGRNIWHEVGMLSVALSRPIERLNTWREAEEFVQRKNSLLILSDSQSIQLRDFTSTQSPLKTEASKTIWTRWKAKGKFPFKELILNGRSEITDFQTRMKREFILLSR